MSQYADKIKKLEKKVFEFFILSKLGKSLISLQDIDELARVFVCSVSDASGAGSAVFILYDPEKEIFQYQYSIGHPDGPVQELCFAKKEGLLWQVLNGGDPFPVRDSSGECRFQDQLVEWELDGLNSELWVPLVVNNVLRGILLLGPKKDGTPYEHRDRQFIAQLAMQAAIAIDIAVNNQHRRKAARDLEKKMNNLSVLYDVSKALNFTNNFKSTLLMILDKSRAAVNAQKGSIMLLNEETKLLELIVVRGIDELTDKRINDSEIETSKIRLGEGVAGKVAQSKELMVIANARNDERFMASDSSNVANIICLPLIVEDKCIGVMNITNKSTGEEFSSEDIELLTMLAGQVAVTINNANLYNLAITDGLTQCFIKRYFDQLLHDEMTRARRYQRPLSVVMLDIDHFKAVNDTYGHQQGDLVLAEAGQIIRTSIREMDSPARYGGEEFVILMPETEGAQTLAMAERIRQLIESHEFTGISGTPIRVTVSIGIAMFPRNAASEEGLIRRADMALYKSKEEGRNRITVSEEDAVSETQAGF